MYFRNTKNYKKMEIWKPIKGYVSIYEISNKGNVKRLSRTVERNKVGALNYPEKNLAKNINKYGYVYVSLQLNGKRINKLIHRLVIEAFGKGEKKATVNHIDGNKQNNCLENLEYATAKENIQHAISTGLRGLPNTKKVQKIEFGEITVYETVKEAAKENKVSPALITFYCQGKRTPKNKNLSFNYF